MKPALPLLILACAAAISAPLYAADQCEARAGAKPPAIVELYTSEGCSSCPPADRWLSQMKNTPDVIALAFHVNYWDRLGWPDRFANAATTERQHVLQRASGARFVYTPQVIVDGRDWPQWSGGAALPRAAAIPAPTLLLQREGQRVTASVGPSRSALSGYWAVLEDGHSSRVRAGENAGSTLTHDHVVTLYQPVAAWPAGEAARRWELTLPAPTAGAKARAVAFVVTDPATQRPLQAVRLGC